MVKTQGDTRFLASSRLNTGGYTVSASSRGSEYYQYYEWPAVIAATHIGPSVTLTDPSKRARRHRSGKVGLFVSVYAVQ